MKPFYAADLAYVHDKGYLAFAAKAAPGILRILSRCCSRGDRVVEIGCGSGGLTERLDDAGYKVLAVDISGAMLALARRRAPNADFSRASFYTMKPPRCSAIVALGECVNYMQAARAKHDSSLKAFFGRAYEALPPGGVLIFDFLEADPSRPRRNSVHNSGTDWMVFVDGAIVGKVLRRRITTVRLVGDRFRQASEVHRQYLYRRKEITSLLEQTGFSAVIRNGYGAFRLRKGHRVALAVKRGQA